MANLKNITDLPMAESTEGLNLIVNDNGAAKQIAADKVGRVKSVNGAEPDDNGNVEIEIPEEFSGSWNDLTDKPFYTEEEPVEVEVVAETTVTIPQDGDPFGFLVGPIFKHGKEYIVNWNGVQYTSKAIDFGNGNTVLGNGSLFVFGDLGNIGNNEPFFFAPLEGPGMYFVFATQPGTYTVSMKTIEESVHHLDPKYIKDMYYEYMGPNTDDVMWEQTVTTESDYAFVNSGDMNVNQFLTEGATYIVTWNDTEYTCVARKDSWGDIYIGNQAIAIEANDGWTFPESITSNEPFFFCTHEERGEYCLIAQNAGEYTVSIYGTGEKLTPRKIDVKYMPYEIMDELENHNNWISNLDIALSNKMNKSNPSGTGSFSLNRKSGTTYGQYSFAEGYDGTASGDYSHAEGYNTTASGKYSHAEGWKTIASGMYSHAEGGNSTTASGSYAHAEGHNSKALGSGSHAEGNGCIAKGEYSHAEGLANIATSQGQHAQGKYCIEDTGHKYAHIVGNGTALNFRSNAHTLDWDGNAWYSGDVYVGSTSGTNKDEGSRKLIPSPATAQVGQTIVVKSVDANGKPTEWECVDMASGGGDIPEALPNPHALTLTGAVTAEYDGSQPLSVEIPEGEKEFTLINTIKLTEEVREVIISEDASGNPFAYKEILIVQNTSCGESAKQQETVYISGTKLNNRAIFGSMPIIKSTGYYGWATIRLKIDAGKVYAICGYSDRCNSSPGVTNFGSYGYGFDDFIAMAGGVSEEDYINQIKLACTLNTVKFAINSSFTIWGR